MEQYPLTDGFALASDWAVGEGTWLIWPPSAETWIPDYEQACLTIAEIARKILTFQTVKVVAPARYYPVIRLQLGPDAEIIARECDDCWISDISPFCLKHETKKPTGVIPVFNGWGNRSFSYNNDRSFAKWFIDRKNIDYYKCPLTMEMGMVSSDGQGTLLVCRESFFDVRRNPILNFQEVEHFLALYFGARKIIWLDGVGTEGVAAGQIVPLARFTKSASVVCLKTSNKDSPYQKILSSNAEKLKDSTDSLGRPLKVSEVPLPTQKIKQGLEIFPSYLSYRKFSNCIMIPGFNDDADPHALEVLSDAHPDIPVLQCQMSVLGGKGSGLFGLLLPDTFVLP